MDTFRVSLLLCFFGVLSARKGSLERLCEEGKDWHKISSLKAPEGGNGSLDLRLNTTKQILVCKCDPQEEFFVGLLGKLQRQTTEPRIFLINQTFIVQNAERTDEGIYITTELLNEGTILAVVNLTIDGPPVPPSEILPSTAFASTIPKSLPNSGISKPPVPSPDLPSSMDIPKALVIGLSVAILAVVVVVAAVVVVADPAAAAVFFIVRMCMKKRRHNESSSSYVYSKLDGQVDGC